MKKVFLCCLAALALISCSSMQSVATPTQASAITATNNDGSNAGKALRALYTNYKATGKFDYSDPTNLLSAISLISSCQNLKANVKNTAYWTSFAEGLVVGSNNLVTDQISNTVTTQLSDLVSQVDMSKLESAAEKASAVKSVTGDITNLLSLFK